MAGRERRSVKMLWICCAMCCKTNYQSNGVLAILTATDSKDRAMINVPTQLTTLATAIAFGRGA